MSRSRGRRFEDTPPKLNMKKVIATIITIIVLIMIIVSLKKILTPSDPQTKEISSLTTYIPVFENGEWGVIDNKGNIVINLSYDEMVVVPDENKDIFICNYNIDYNTETYDTKVINSKGEELLTNYNKITPLENTKGSKTWYEKNVLKFEENGKYGLINLDGKKLVEPEYDNIYTLSGIENSVIIEKDGKKGLFNTVSGEIIIEAKYVDISSVSDTYEKGYIVKNDSNRCGIIGADKSVILTQQYDEIKNVTGNNNYVVVQNGVLEVVDSSEKVVLNSGYDSIESINFDNFIITKNGKYGIINKKGETIISPEYENMKFAMTDTYIAQKNGKYGIINKDNEVKIDFQYTDINYIETADFLQAEKDNYKTDIIDRNLNIALSNVIISELNLEDGYLRVRVNDEYKYYNFKLEEKSNKDVLTTNTLFLIQENGKYGYENKNGNRIVDAIYDDAKEQNSFGYCAVNKDGKWGVLKSDGTVLVEPSRNLDNYLYIDFIGEWNLCNDLSLNVYTK